MKKFFYAVFALIICAVFTAQLRAQKGKEPSGQNDVVGKASSVGQNDVVDKASSRNAPSEIEPAPATADITPIMQPTPDYVNRTSLMPVTQPDFTVLPSITDGTCMITFTPPLQVRTVPGSWVTWGSPPDTEGSTPRVLFTQGAMSLTLDFAGCPSSTFGFEAEPDPFGPNSMTAHFFSGATEVGMITRVVDGQTGARLFAADAVDTNFTRVVFSSLVDFAVARLRYALGGGVRFLDLKCYNITGEPLNLPLHLDHLNPLFRRLGLPPEDVILQQPQQLCVPVAKNGVLPPPDVLRVIQFIDLKCYGITGDPLNLPLQLDHLNPVLQQLGAPPEVVTVLDPTQLCVPVAKNGQIPPDDVLRIVQFIDQKCYNITGDPLNLLLHLDHLNPVLQLLGAPPEDVVPQQPQQLCVPVAKNGQIPPPDVLPIVQLIDQKCYNITGDPLNLPLHLDHLNPVLQQLGAPPEDVFVLQPQQLCVPVNKSLP